MHFQKNNSLKFKRLIILTFLITLMLTCPLAFAEENNLLTDESNLSSANELDLNSEAALLVEVNTGKVLFEKNADKVMYPASTTKILTAIVVLENCDLSEMATVSESALSNIPSGYVTCNLQVGEEMSVNDLLHALLIPSANDAAFVLAEHVGGSVQGFSDMMNKKAKEIGCTNTHFVNPNGIHSDDHYSTAYDLYLMGKYAMQNETFKSIVSKTEYTLPATNKYPNEDRVLHTSNALIDPKNKNYYYEPTIGIKTGHTSQAGNCLVAESSKNNIELIAVILNGGTTSNGLNARFVDTKTLFEYGYENYSYDNIIEKNTPVTTIEIENGTKETRNLNLVAEETQTAFHSKSTDLSTISPEITLEENIFAPITAGTVLGTAKYNVDGLEYETKLLAESDVEQKLDISIILLIVGFTLLMLSMIVSRKGRKKKRKSRR